MEFENAVVIVFTFGNKWRKNAKYKWRHSRYGKHDGLGPWIDSPVLPQPFKGIFECKESIGPNVFEHTVGQSCHQGLFWRPPIFDENIRHLCLCDEMRRALHSHSPSQVIVRRLTDSDISIPNVPNSPAWMHSLFWQSWKKVRPVGAILGRTAPTWQCSAWQTVKADKEAPKVGGCARRLNAVGIVVAKWWNTFFLWLKS